ncbi:hypothetical protein Areg01_09200 [Actinoplanes regularis]|nr:hypothetical protein Areg01_09200 [Actinoplanes regularis]
MLLVGGPLRRGRGLAGRAVRRYVRKVSAFAVTAATRGGNQGMARASRGKVPELGSSLAAGLHRSYPEVGIGRFRLR